MRATDILKGEHRVMDQMLTCLEELADECLVERRLDAAAARQVVGFLHNFVGCCHQAWEEDRLFRLLEPRGVSRPLGPTAGLLHEHQLCGRNLRALVQIIEPAVSGDPYALRQFASQARAYVFLLREHMAREECRLLSLGDPSPTDEDALLEAFDHVEGEEPAEETHERYLATADEMGEQFEVHRVPVEPVAHPSCCWCGHHGATS